MFYYSMGMGDQGINIVDRCWIISADLGQANDYTAISVIERTVKGDGILGFDKRGERSLYLRHIERMRGIPYPKVIERIEQIYHSPALKGIDKCVTIDLTGLGRPVADMMKKEGFNYSLTPISITGGTDATFTNGHYNVPKAELVSNLQIQLQNGTLKFANGMKEANALIEELSNFQTRIHDNGRETYDGRYGYHDDLVLSVALGVWLACRRNICRHGDDKIM